MKPRAFLARMTLHVRPLHRSRRGHSALLFPLLLFAAFAFSLLTTLRVTSNLTSRTLERRIRAVGQVARWNRRGLEDGDDDLLGSHLTLFDGDNDGEEAEGEGDEIAASPPAGACAPMEHTDYFGTPIVEGPDFVVASAQECCEACANYKPRKKEKGSESKGGGGGGGVGETDPSLECSLWVFCGDEERCGEALGQCWLKHLAWPEASNPRVGEDVPWTSGLRSGRLSPALEEEREEEEKERGRKVEERWPSPPSPATSLSTANLPSSPPRNRRSYHVAITASGPAVHWQSRVHFYWYKKQKRLCEAEARRANEEEEATATEVDENSTSAAEKPTPSSSRRRRRHQCDMGGFTRVLHDPAGAPDDLSREIPTFVASPLPEGVDGGYVVLNRPWAFVQWLAAASIAEDFVLMAEPDHLWLRPLQNPCPPAGSPAAFPFFYIEPSKEEYLPLVARALGRKTGRISREEAEEIAPIGNSPTWMRTRDLTKLAPLWMETSQLMFRDPETRKAWGWVLEMYGFTVSLHKGKAERERAGEERAVLEAVAAAAAKKKKKKRAELEGSPEAALAARGGEDEESSLSSFPPLSSETSEAAREARRLYRSEKRRRRKRGGSGGRGGGGGEVAVGKGGEDGEGEVETLEDGRVRVLPRVMLQPPWDSRITPGAALLHYTYGCDYALNGTFLPGERGEWRFDKREWAAAPPTREELRGLWESAPLEVRESAPATFKIVEMLLEAVEAVPGWDSYARSGVATEFWDGETFL